MGFILFTRLSVLKDGRVTADSSNHDAIEKLVSDHGPDEYMRTKHEARMADLYNCDGEA